MVTCDSFVTVSFRGILSVHVVMYGHGQALELTVLSVNFFFFYRCQWLHKKKHLQTMRSCKGSTMRKDEVAYVQVTKLYGVPCMTYEKPKHRNYIPAAVAIQILLGRTPALPQSCWGGSEALLCVHETVLFWVHNHASSWTSQVAEKVCFHIRFNKDDKCTGKGWLAAFLLRKCELNCKFSESASFSGGSSFNQKVQTFFHILEVEISKHQFPPRRIFSAAEKGVTILHYSSLGIIATKQTRRIYTLKTRKNCHGCCS